MMLSRLLIAALIAAPTFATAEEWHTSPFGKEDTLGALNYITPEKTRRAAQLVKQGKVYQLGMITAADTPAYGPRRFQMIVHQLSDGAGVPLGSNEAVGNDDTVLTSIGIGSQIDGLGHIGRKHRYYNGRTAAEVVAPDGLKLFGTDTLPGIVTRGVVLDMTQIFAQTPVASGTAYTKAHIMQAAAAQNITLESGDVVLLHSGYLTAHENSKEFVPTQPGLGVSGAHYLAQQGVAAVGADSWALEAIPHEDQTAAFPVHQILLAKYGVYILENMRTQALVDDGVSEFMFTLGVPKLKGAVQAIINPLAIR